MDKYTVDLSESVRTDWTDFIEPVSHNGLAYVHSYAIGAISSIANCWMSDASKIKEIQCLLQDIKRVFSGRPEARIPDKEKRAS